jgi:DNA repair exonuclease SbcCD ATPase subunit
VRIHRIRLRDFRGVLESEVSFAPQGVTIIEGDNEAGKTSLAHAIRLILDYRDDSSHKSVKAARPVGRDVGAEVEIEVSTGPYRFVYAKRWHRQRQTTLSILEPRREQLAGREAHDRVLAILGETLDRPLWDALRLEQGAKLDQAGFDVVSLSQALDVAAGGGDTAGAQGDDLWERICDERDRYWTPSGQPHRGRVTMAASVTEARAKVALVAARLRELEADTEEVARLVEEASYHEARQVAHEEAEADLICRAGLLAELQARVRQLCAERDTAAAEHAGALLRWGRRGDQLESVAAALAAVSGRETELERGQPARVAAERRHGEAQDALRLARWARQTAEADLALAAGDRDHRRQQIELEQLTERHDRVVDAQLQLNQAEGLIESIRVDDDLVVRIEVAHLEVAKARAAADSGAALVSVTALSGLEIDVDGRRHTMDAGSTDERSVAAPFELTVPDVVRLRVRPGAEARVLAERLHQAEEELAALCDLAGVADLAQARAFAAQRDNAVRVRAAAVTAIRQDLRDLTLDALARKIERVAARVNDYAESRAAEPPMLPDFDAAQAQAKVAEAHLAERQAEVGRAETDAGAAADAVAAAAVGDARLVALLDQARSALTQAEHSLQAARVEVDDDSLQAAVRAAEESRDTTAAAALAAQRALAAEDPDSLEVLLSNARAAKARGAAALHANRERRRVLAVKLDLFGEQGMAAELDEATTRLRHLEREHDSLEARAEAARRLHATFAARRAEAHSRYVAPFRRKIEQLARLVFGPTLEVELDADLRIARRTLDGVTVDFDQLSTGAQEQLGLISRLACATLVAPDGGAPVIFDDALGWSDPHRLERMGAVIAVAGRDCQVIVLTCTPGRYANVGTATVVRLSA